MDTNVNNDALENDDDQKNLSLKRIITVSSDDEEDKEMNKPNKRQRSTSLTKLQPLKIMNQQPVIRNTRQTSLSIIRTTRNDNSNEERKWNLKTMNSSRNESSSKQQKKTITQMVSFLINIFY